MQAYSRSSVKSYYVSNTTTGGTTTLTQNNANDRFWWLSGANLNKQGNFRDPQPFQFTKLFWEANPGVRVSRASPSPGGQQYLPYYHNRVLDASSSAQPLNSRSFTELEAVALSKIYNKIRGQSNLAVDVAEGKKTILMLKSLLGVRKRVLDLVTVTLKARVNAGGSSVAKARLDYASERWLEVRYGIMPLIYSTYDLLDTIHRNVMSKDFYYQGRGFRGISETERKVSGSDSYADPGVYRTLTYIRRSQMRLRFNLPPTNSIYDYTSVNPAGIAWELFPLSFVLDWFVNIGDTLKLWEDYWLFNSLFRDGYITNTYIEKVSVRKRGRTVTPPVWGTPKPDGSQQLIVRGTTDYTNSGESRRMTYKDRRLVYSLPSPARPTIQVSLNAKRYVDAAALTKLIVFKRLGF